MDTMAAIARTAIDTMPPESRFTEADARVIARHQTLLLGLENEMIKGFYDTLYTHQATAAVFREGERSIREESLSFWWRRTVTGPLDDGYFAWMAMVGLIHVIRRVSNPMMLAMAEFTAAFVAEHVEAMGLDPDEAAALVHAFRRLTAVAGAIIVSGFDHAVASALYEVAGMPTTLLERLRDQEILEALDRARTEVQGL